jgi:hypothetical protein
MTSFKAGTIVCFICQRPIAFRAEATQLTYASPDDVGDIARYGGLGSTEHVGSHGLSEPSGLSRQPDSWVVNPRCRECERCLRCGRLQESW